jgi:hypothetical protein
MAIIINNNGEVENVSPKNKKFTKKELIDLFDGFKFTDMGVFISISHNETEGKELNSVATLFLRFPVYGKIMIVSGQEIHEELEITTDLNSKHSPLEHDEGTMILLRETLMAFQLVTGLIKDPAKIRKNETYKKEEKSIMFFDPQRIKDESKKTDDDVKFLDEFFDSAYESIKKTKNISDTVVFEGETYKIKLAKDHITESLNLMLDHFIEKEEYEKSAEIRDVIKKENEH